jgi:hypothetical protein
MFSSTVSLLFSNLLSNTNHTEAVEEGQTDKMTINDSQKTHRRMGHGFRFLLPLFLYYPHFFSKMKKNERLWNSASCSN